MLAALLVTIGALVMPVQRATWPLRAPGSSMMIRIAKSSDWDDIEKEITSRVGLGKEDADDAEAMTEPPTSESAAAPASAGVLPPAPRRGEQPWGSWSHEGEEIELSLSLPPGTRAKDVSCTVSKESILLVETNGEQLLTGKLALPVDRMELSWLVETLDDESKLLCLELPLLPIDTSDRSRSVDCIFDESLVVNGKPCRAPGLSGVAGKA